MIPLYFVMLLKCCGFGLLVTVACDGLLFGIGESVSVTLHSVSSAFAILPVYLPVLARRRSTSERGIISVGVDLSG